ncbi:GNAT family N-acetyltransferase [Solimonas sp. SE-A11]|uniref:GNAT family N-acetyltransferase n=1 Tax=Solimonas sp. SE-A11 TaxID=3054954 RepID=UPI00259D1337|nr:GNAT family N-acetyltransferase [Solimonas sp. SE-A11]MDM4769010.1 GNAT family N-acetyltransferase [Solimonas sp. SE-A11]
MSAAPSIDMQIASSRDLSAAQRQEILVLCSAAYEEDFSAYLEMLDPAMHLLVYADGLLVSHGAWVERELRAEAYGRLRCAYVEAIATLPEQQGRGYGSLVLSRMPSLFDDYDIAVLSPSAEAFYQRLGWETWQGALSYRSPEGEEIATPEEQVMIHRLPRTPAWLDTRTALSVDWRPLEVW